MYICLWYHARQVHAIWLEANNEHRDQLVISCVANKAVVANHTRVQAIIVELLAVMTIRATTGNAERTPVFVRRVCQVVSFSRCRCWLLGSWKRSD